MKKYSILLVLSLIFLFSTAQNDNVNKVKAVIDKYNKVTGLDKLSKNPPKTFLQESKMTSFFSDQPNISWITIIGDSENERAYMVQESSDNSKIETLFNKDRGWILTNDGTTLELDENMLSSMSKLTDFLKSSTASMTDISNMKYVETITEGKNTYNVLQLISPENSKVNMYFNERTGLLDYSISFLNEEQKKVLHTEQQKQTFNNYTQFGDVMLPDFYTENNGKIGLMFETKRISLDYPIDNVDFSENKFKLGLDAYSYYSKGLNTENDREAIELFDKAITIRPNYIDAHLARIKNYQNLNDYQSAINLCDRLLRIDDNNTSALFYRASSYLILGNYSKAKNDCKTILAYEPENKVISEFMDNISKIENENIAIKNEIKENQKAEKKKTVMNIILGCLSIANDFANYYVSTNTEGGSFNSGSSSNIKYTSSRQVCPTCWGTGKNETRERPPFYDYSTETNDHPACSICGDKSNHWHKDCSGCGGSGYVNR